MQKPCGYSYVTCECGDTRTTAYYTIHRGALRTHHRCKNHQPPRGSFDTAEEAWAAEIANRLTHEQVPNIDY